jgi:hypothetical protein
MTKKIFLSVGRTSTGAQKKFVEELETFLKANDLTPQTVGRNYFSSLQPLATINQ